MPEKVLEASFGDFYNHEERNYAFDQEINFCLSFDLNNRPTKGLYLYGGFGVGKTYLAAAICNQLSRWEIDSCMVHFPSFVTDLKSSIKNGSIEDKLKVCEEVTVLVLDDVGAEYLTNWVLHNVYFPILHYRAIHRLPTIYTSSLSPQELENHLATPYIKNGKIEDRLTARQLIQKITKHTQQIVLRGPNYRLGH